MKRLEHVAEQVKLGDSKESRKKILHDRYVCMHVLGMKIRKVFFSLSG